MIIDGNIFVPDVSVEYSDWDATQYAGFKKLYKTDKKIASCKTMNGGKKGREVCYHEEGYPVSNYLFAEKVLILFKKPTDEEIEYLKHIEKIMKNH